MMDMSGSTNQFDPFARHRMESRPEPVQPDHKAAEAIVVDQPTDVKPIKTKPLPAAHADNPFAAHAVEPKVQTVAELSQEPQPPQLLLNWLRNNWAKPVISLRTIQHCGPSGIRDRKSAITHLEMLERWGWLVPMKAHRRDRRIWMLPPAMPKPEN
jgi:hypothetical protein